MKTRAGGGDLVTSFYVGHGALHTELAGVSEGQNRILADVCVSRQLWVDCAAGWLFLSFLGSPSGCGTGEAAARFLDWP